MGLRRDPQFARLLFIYPTNIALKEACKHVYEPLWVPLHDIVFCVTHSEQLRFAGQEECVGLDDPVSAFRTKKVPITVRAPYRKAGNVEQEAGGAKGASDVCRTQVWLKVDHVQCA